MARVKLIVSKDDVAPEHHTLFDELAALRGRVSGPSTVVLHSPGLARPWNAIGEYLHRESIVEPQHAELAVCATAREKDCGFVWNAHVPLAQKAGLTAETIDVVRHRRPVAGLSGPERAVVLYVRQLLETNRVESEVFDQLLKAHDARWLVELTGWIGRYGALAGILNAFEVTPGAPVDVLPPAPSRAPTPTKVRPPLPTPRITPITHRDQVEEQHRPIFDAVAEGRGSVRGPFSLLMQSPVLCARVLEVSTYLRFNSRVKPNPGEVAILATAREKDCPYVWSAHAPLARRAGVSETAIAVVGEGGDLTGLPSVERDTVDYVRQLLRTNRVDQPLFDRLREQHGVPWLVELTALIGHYGTVTGILNAFEMAPPMKNNE